MFRTLIYPSSGAATILLNYRIGRVVLGSMCVGVSVWLGWSGIRVAGWSLEHGCGHIATSNCVRQSAFWGYTGMCVLFTDGRKGLCEMCCAIICAVYTTNLNATTSALYINTRYSKKGVKKERKFNDESSERWNTSVCWNLLFICSYILYVLHSHCGPEIGHDVRFLLLS